ncbi:MAG: type II toxin-antitoxin system prevent-host-death family antitoxin [Rhodocyclaceae bacterium]|nr:type II toxin-antitoxin system prevent-host-death family antitoxin [Rhodocyclaceae bacterium]
MRTVSIRDANQSFSRLIREVEAGETVVITRQGKPVAKLTRQVANRLDDPEVRDRLDRLRSCLRKWPRDGYRLGSITEDDKYGDAEL